MIAISERDWLRSAVHMRRHVFVAQLPCKNEKLTCEVTCVLWAFAILTFEMTYFDEAFYGRCSAEGHARV